jgi:glycosyltransferase involved in cell wall biosynthesis
VTTPTHAPRILIVPSWYPDVDDDVRGVFIRDQADVLSQSTPVAVLSPRIRSWRDASSRAGRLVEISHARGYPEIRPVAFLPPKARMPVASYRAFRRALLRGLETVGTAWGAPDIVHAHVVLPAGWAVASVAGRLRAPIILSEHTGPFSVHTANEAQRRMVVQAFEGAGRVTVVSRYLLASVRAEIDAISPRLEPQIDVVGNVVRTQIFTPGADVSPTGSPEFLVVALLDKVKGVDILLRAVSLAAPRLGGLRLNVVGDGPERAPLEALAHELGLSDTVRFLGRLGRAQVVERMRDCTALVSPSRLETFGLAPAEAMACGKPVVATRSGGPQEFVTPESGVLVDVESPEQLAEAMVAVARGAAGYDATRIRESIAERFGEAAFTERMLALYRDVMERQ